MSCRSLDQKEIKITFTAWRETINKLQTIIIWHGEFFSKAWFPATIAAIVAIVAIIWKSLLRSFRSYGNQALDRPLLYVVIDNLDWNNWDVTCTFYFRGNICLPILVGPFSLGTHSRGLLFVRDLWKTNWITRSAAHNICNTSIGQLL